GGGTSSTAGGGGSSHVDASALSPISSLSQLPMHGRVLLTYDPAVDACPPPTTATTTIDHDPEGVVPKFAG
ncbi:MAG: hypothetical protein RL486_105, partial [Actinomycetota bacterium]